MVHGKYSGFTPAAERTVQWCRQLLSMAATADDRAALLVLALLHDESLASACLQDLGVTVEWLQAGGLGSAVTAVVLSGLPQRFESEGSGCGPQRSLVMDEDPGDFRDILQRARDLARRESADQPITSSLLLLAVPDQNSFVRERLARQGGTLDVLRGRLLPEQNSVVEKLNLEEPLEWSIDSAASASESTSFSERSETRLVQVVSGVGTGLGTGNSTGTATGDMASSVLRVIDASLNRAREGLRVLEDCARFVLNAAALCGELKSLRHQLAEAEQQFRLRIPSGQLPIEVRDTSGDVGTQLTDPRERVRVSLQQLVLANARRVQESLRSLEEFGKLLDPEFAAVMKQLRYHCYTVEQNMSLLYGHSDAGNTAEQRIQKLRKARLCVLITESQCRLPWLEAAEQALAGGADVLQLREKQLADRELLQRARRLRQLCRAYDALFIMNDRPDLAMAADADGVHVGQEELSVAEVRSLPGWHGLIGVSTHSVQQLEQAFVEGADYVGVGPVFPSSTKVFQDFPGLSFVEQAAAAAAGPWFAIGGIHSARLPELLAAGARRIAVTAAVTQSQNPTEAAQLLRNAVEL
ncbi:MAG: thiamine phosphate synthase [Planctomycetaceae bacterium]